jgi:hypothetical protein
MTPNMMSPGMVVPVTNLGDPGAQQMQNRLASSAIGSQLEAYDANQQQYYNNAQSAYANAANVEGANIGNTPGYTTDELGNILQTSQYQAGETTPQGYASLAPTQAQSAAMLGDPNSLYNSFDPNAILNTVNTSQGNQQQFLTNADTALGTAQANMGAGYDSAMSNPGLSYDPTGSFLNSVEGAYTGAASNIGAADTNANLSLTNDLNPNTYNMSDAQVQQIENQAATGVGAATAAQNQAYENAALASGNADPMSVAALQQQNRVQGDEASAAAVTNATLAAQAQQRSLEMNYAQTQLGAQQTESGMQVGAGENLLGQQLGEANNYQQSSLAAEQNLANLGMSATTNEANAAYQNAMYGGNAGIGIEQNVGQQMTAGQEYGQTTGENLAANVNQLNTTYANQQYQNQLTNTMYQQQNTFNQNTAVTNTQSAAYQAAANARIAGQNNFLNWSTGQANANANTSLGYTGAENTANATTLGAMNQATATGAQWGLGLNNSTFSGQLEQGLGKGLATAAVGSSAGAPNALGY